MAIQVSSQIKNLITGALGIASLLVSLGFLDEVLRVDLAVSAAVSAIIGVIVPFALSDTLVVLEGGHITGALVEGQLETVLDEIVSVGSKLSPIESQALAAAQAVLQAKGVSPAPATPISTAPAPHA